MFNNKCCYREVIFQFEDFTLEHFVHKHDSSKAYYRTSDGRIYFNLEEAIVGMLVFRKYSNTEAFFLFYSILKLLNKP